MSSGSVKNVINKMETKSNLSTCSMAQSAGAVEYTDCISAEG